MTFNTRDTLKGVPMVYKPYELHWHRKSIFLVHEDFINILFQALVEVSSLQSYSMTHLDLPSLM